MKRTLIFLCTLVLALALAAPVLADENPTSGTTKLTAEIAEKYTITIPDNTGIVFNTASTSIGNIGLATAWLMPGHAVKFTADVTTAGVGELDHASSATSKLAYTLKINDIATNTVSFTAVGTQAVTVEIASDAWAAAPAGNYSDIITFTIVCE